MNETTTPGSDERGACADAYASAVVPGDFVSESPSFESDRFSPVSDETPPDVADSESADEPSCLTSVCFWTVLIAAAAIYGSVALSPKFMVWLQLSRRHEANSTRIAVLEDEIAYQARVINTLESDPEFVSQLSTRSFRRVKEGTELIPVSGSLLFGAESAEPMRATEREPTLIVRAAEHLAVSRRTRSTLLAVAALMTLGAFSFLNDGGAENVRAAFRVLGRLVTMPLRRYVRSSGDGESGLPAESAAEDDAG